MSVSGCTAPMQNRIDIDTSLWPVVRVTPYGNLTDADYEAMFKSFDTLWRRRERMLSLTDTRKSGNATPKQRQMIGEWLKTNTNTMERYSLGSVVLVESTLVRGALTAIDWISGSKIRSEYVGNWNQAVDKVKELLIKQGLPYQDLIEKLRQVG
jgi:hypothetical protein